MNRRSRNRAKAGGEISAARMRLKKRFHRKIKRALMLKGFTETEAQERVEGLFGAAWM